MEAQTAEPAPESAPEVVEAAPEVAPEAPVEAAPEAPSARARDDAGRFARAEKPTEKPAAPPDGAQKAGVKPAAAGLGKADGAAPPVAPPAEPTQPSAKAPQAWTPQAREAFAKAPPEVQREVERREREMSRFMQESAPIRQFAQSVQQSLAPYETIARANGTDAMTWAGNALQMVASLYAGTPQQRAATIARAIHVSGADLDAINQALSGQQQAAPSSPQFGPTDIEQIIEQRFAQREAAMEQQQNLTTVQQFLETQPEFIDDVFPDMVQLLKLDRAKGGNMTPQQAYDRTCKYSEGVQSVLSSRKATEAARANAPTVQRSKAAAVSIKPSPVAANPAGSRGTPSLRETIESAVAGQRT
jgi:hypothetical protein